MSLLHTPQFASWVRGHLLCRVENVPDRFALTFDDGPSARTTPGLLDLLARHGARATFFTLAANVARRPELIRRMVAEGHEPALHGEMHLPMPLLAPALVRREIDRSAAALASASGVRARHFRPPFGFMMPAQAKFILELGYVSVLGDVYPEDAHRPGTSRIIDRVMRRLRPGSILILHDRSQTLAATDAILTRMAERRVRATTVADLLSAAVSEAGIRGA
jgi:peptidoglycan/xylan/chitin deacetylase (PgdA/CDA1 family)